ncbi:hypothetical protein GCM10007421_20480 [Halopseudomonas oceani]|uniref:Uncharacterized protein n=1 Tax=Halopseudomonas oceani TaxID=1708783 RepID=A0A2P4EQL8_9GAMM|nr:hypothetical protein [Halopseudomonas oceani]POB00912.1 hypothetical protein C1949_18160 [Halopseudomonas oceani]GGE46164.1 hypothetical protein GCM10007421_20480 [Halopseudomonas oceani]
MKQYVALALTGLLGLGSFSAQACTPEESIAKGELLAQLIYDRTKDQPGKADELNARLKALQEQDPANGRYDSCQGYQRIIDELEGRVTTDTPAENNQ